MTPCYQWDAVTNENGRHTDDELVGLPAKQHRVDRPHEGVHAIEAFWCRAGCQPFEIAVGTRDIAVRAGRDVDDDLATLRHESDLRCQEPTLAPIRAAI